MSFTLFFKIFEIESTKGKKIKANKLRHHTRKIVNQITIQTFGSNTDIKNLTINGSINIHTNAVTKLNQTCRNATCFFIANEFFHIAHIIIVIVDHKYPQNIIGNANVGDKIHEPTVANTIINVILQDCTKRVSISQKRKNSHGLIHVNIERSISVKKLNPFFIKENAKKIKPKLSKNFPNDSTLFQREKKFIQTAQKSINGNAIIDTSKLNQTIHKIEVGIIVHIFTQRITANAEVKDNIHAQTNANTSTDIIFELCKIVVIKIQLQKDFDTDDVNFFIKFLNHQFEKPDTACSI